MVIWKSEVGVLVRTKQGLEYGDVPVINFNEITKRIEPVVNPRGKAYAARNRACYRKNRRNLLDKSDLI